MVFTINELFGARHIEIVVAASHDMLCSRLRPGSSMMSTQTHGHAVFIIANGLPFAALHPGIGNHEYNGSGGISLMMRPFVRSR